MNTILLDANIIIAILFNEEERHDDAYAASRIAADKFHIVLSPATFVICNYYIEKDFKRHKNKTKPDSLLQRLYLFNYSAEDDAIIRQVQESAFHDKEDAVQYFSALRSSATGIVTFDVHDYLPYAHKLKIYHPFEFILKFH